MPQERKFHSSPRFTKRKYAAPYPKPFKYGKGYMVSVPNYPTGYKSIKNKIVPYSLDVMKKYGSYFGPQNPQSRVPGRKSGVSRTVLSRAGDKFAGKFPKGRKKNVNKQSMAKFARSGVIKIRETVGTVTDADCVYLYSHSIVPIDIIEMIGAATMRKLLERAFKTKYTSMDNFCLMGNYNATPGLYNVVFTWYDAVTGAENSNVITVNGTKTVQDVSEELTSILLNYSSGNGFANAANPREPFLLSVYKQINLAADSILLATMNLHNEYIEMQCTLEMKVQNRSVSASGSKDTDQVDSNPVQGYIYEFSSIPKSRDPVNVTGGNIASSPRAYDFASIRFNDGMNLVRGGDMPSGYREPITARNFTNCKGVSKVRLEPGCIKNLYRSYRKNINFVKFLQDLNLQVDQATGNARVIKTLGGGVMLSFEDVINVNSSAIITLTYEAERKSGVILKTRGHTDITPIFQQSVFNNPEIIP